jgi:hypothetical protein
MHLLLVLELTSANRQLAAVTVILDIWQGHRRKFGREPSKEYHIEFRPVVVPKNIKM